LIIASAIRALALAHFTLLEVSPLELIDL